MAAGRLPSVFVHWFAKAMNRFGTVFYVVVIGKAGVDSNVYLHGRNRDFAVESKLTENLDYIGQTRGVC
jgi:hypothetical protein